MGKFTLNIGPGNTIGAMAFGPGAKAEGEVKIGGAPEPPTDKYKATVEIVGAPSREQIAAWLEQAAREIRKGNDVCAVGKVDTTAEKQSGCAWRVERQS